MSAQPNVVRRAGVLAAFFVSICASACTTTLGPPESLAVREASRLGTRVARVEGQSQGVPCGLNRLPIVTLAEPAAEEAQAGYDNRRVEGGTGVNDPFACDRWQIHHYTASFVFDFSDLPDPVIVDSAVLTIARRPSSIAWRNPEMIRDEPGCALELRTGAEAWTDPYFVGGSGTAFAVRAGGSNVARNEVRVADRSNMISFNVRNIVTGWLSRGEANNGFVLKQTRIDGSGPSGENNNSCTNIYSGATLTLTIRRFIPREDP
jgi:hypothetical protein